MTSEYIDIHRLIYVDQNYSLNDEEYRIANDSQTMSKVTPVLRQLYSGEDQLFGMFGDEIALKTCLQSFFPNNHTQINSIFAKTDPMPAIWAVYNKTKFVFLLISTHDTISTKENEFMVVMQKFLQDICQHILICPSDVFFSNFSTEQSFHGKPYGTETFVVTTERSDNRSSQKVTLDDKYILKTLLNEQHGHILTTNNTPNTYYLQKISEKSTESVLNDKFNKLKELLQEYLNTDILTVDLVSKLCKKCQIFLSETQRLQMKNIVSNFLSIYHNEKLAVVNEAKSLIKELLCIGYKIFNIINGTSIDDTFKHQLYDVITDWLINPECIDENATQFAARLTTIYNSKSSKNIRSNFDPQRLDRFISGLQTSDKKIKMQQLQKTLIQDIYVAVTSENQSEIHYDIQQLYYNPVNDTENRLQCLTVTCSMPIKISLNDLSPFLNISVLSELDRLDFSGKIEFIACFKMNDGKSDIITIKRPNIINKKLSPNSGYTVLLHKSGVFRKVTDFYLPNFYFAYAFNQNSHTLVLYNADNGNVTRCPLDEFGRLQNSFLLLPLDKSEKPNGVKSLALTVAQDLLILIDSNSTVYELNISQEDSVNISLLVKDPDTGGHKPGFVATNGDLYETVQTIGEKNPIFFFQAESYIDIIDKTYCQIYSIKLEKHSPLYKMQIFTDFIDTYCVLFNANANEVHCIQNLVSDTRIERQESLGNLDKSTKQSTGNRLLDIIKRGELKFGVPDSSDKTQYYFVLSPEYSTYSDRIQKYFEDLKVTAQLKIGYQKGDLIYSSSDIEQLIKVVVSRVPLQLCTIEMGVLVPLNNGKREKMDHLSSKSFKIEMKAREISFSYLDNILNDINEDIKIIGVMGRQSSGKSYLMNKIFQTRFAVAAGRCTVGIWMSYAVLENTHFIVLDCEGLFSDQRTDDEEIKLTSFLAAVSDITILSQDLGFSRFQDRLFSVLSQAVDKIGKNDELFKGILLVAVRDVSDGSQGESTTSTQKKFLELQKKGQNGFLEQIFSKTFKVQPLHHFENANFDYEIASLRQIFIKHVMKDKITGQQLPRRWRNGKDLADRLKILLLQLYTDDFIDSNEIHTEMKLAELEEEMRNTWTRFHLNGEENIQLQDQQIEKKFENKPCSLKLNHTNLELDENSLESNFSNICKFILNQLHLIPEFSDQTPEETNKIFSFVNELIFEVMNYRREQVRKLIAGRFQKQFPVPNENIQERKTKFMNSVEEYMLSFKLQICLKKCSSCDLKCVNNAQHIGETKFLLEKKKDELIRVQATLKITTPENIEERLKTLTEDSDAANTKRDELQQEMIRLIDELNYLSEKENLEVNIIKCDSDLADEKTKYDSLTERIDEIHQQLKNLLSLEGQLTSTSELSHQLDEDMKQLMTADRYKIDHLNKFMEKFHQNYETNCTYKDELFCFSPKQEQTGEVISTSDFQLNTFLLLKMMTDNANNVCNYRKFIQQYLERIQEQRDTEQQHLESSGMRITEIEQVIVNTEKQKEDITKMIETTKMEYEKIDKQLSETIVEQETLSKDIDEGNQSIDTKISSEIQKIKNYMKNLQDKLNMYVSSSVNNDEIQSRIKQEAVKLRFFLKEKSEKEANLAALKEEANLLNDDIQVKEQLNKDEYAMNVLLEKIDNIQKNIKSIEEEQLLLCNQQSQHQQLNKELNEVNQLMETIYSYDQQIESAHIKLSKETEKKNTKEEYIKKLKTEELDDVEDEENIFKKLNKKIEDIQVTLTDLQEKRTSTCNNNTLLKKIFNDPQFDIYEQQKNKQIHLTELKECSKQLNENIKQLQQSLTAQENKLKEQNETISKNKQVLDLQKAEHEKHMNNVENHTGLIGVGTELLQSLSEVETLLTAALEKLNKMTEAQNLIKEHTSVSNALTLSTNEQNRLDGLREDLNQQLGAKKSNAFIPQYMNTQSCKEQYDIIAKDYDNIHSQTKKLEQELSDISVYLRLKNETTNLEKEAQQDCDCGTNHKCSGICHICLERDQTKKNKCIFSAGHTGDHKCDADHVCTKFCQICRLYGFPEKRCVFAFKHSEPTHHQCESIHQCPITCLCSDPCVIPLEIKAHNVHRCNRKDCWKPCMFSCGNLCAVQNHDHDANAETVPIALGTDIHHMKKHLCDQIHYCKGICNVPGVCKQEYREEPRKWTTESGTEFAYDHIEVEAVRVICGMKIDVGKSAHDETKNHVCGGQHTCTERCPDCGSFCSYLFGHSGKHKTNHRNKDQHIFTSTNPAERIEIVSNVQEGHVRTYKVGESAKPENCSVSCKRRGRSHFHLVECPGGLECREKTHGNSAKHSNDTYYYAPDDPSTKKYDQILCSVYWSLNQWHSPVNGVEQKLIDSCNAYCDKHVERDRHGYILRESVKGFCTLDARHNIDHALDCQNDHQALEMYRGIDVCFVIDATGSMDIYFEKVKKTITCIVEKNPELMEKLKKSTFDFRFSIVDYRDHEPEADYVFHTCNFTTDTLAKIYITKLESGCGGDFPEAVLDALDAACALTWRDNVDRLLFHILDAPPHGRIFTDTTKGEQWPDGCPCGKTAEGVLSIMKKKNIKYHVLPCSSYLNLMIAEFKKYIDVKTLTFDDSITFEDVIAKQVQQQLIDTEMTLRKKDKDVGNEEFLNNQECMDNNYQENCEPNTDVIEIIEMDVDNNN